MFLKKKAEIIIIYNVIILSIGIEKKNNKKRNLGFEKHKQTV